MRVVLDIVFSSVSSNCPCTRSPSYRVLRCMRFIKYVFDVQQFLAFYFRNVRAHYEPRVQRGGVEHIVGRPHRLGGLSLGPRAVLRGGVVGESVESSGAHEDSPRSLETLSLSGSRVV